MKTKYKKVVCVDKDGKKYKVSIDRLSFRPSVYAVIVQDNSVLLSKQWDGYDFPGGAVELGETVKQTLIREVKEETGFEVRVGRVISCENSFFKLPFTNEYVHSILIYYLCSIVGGKLSVKFLDTHEKEYVSEAERVKLNKVTSVKFYNSVDSIQILKEAKRMISKKQLLPVIRRFV